MGSDLSFTMTSYAQYGTAHNLLPHLPNLPSRTFSNWALTNPLDSMVTF